LVQQPLYFGLGNLVRGERKRRNLTQAELSRSAACSVPTVRQVERSRGQLASFFDILTALEMRLDGQNLPQAATLGGRLRALRQNRGLSQAELASILCVSRGSIHNLENNSTGYVRTLGGIFSVLGAQPILLGIQEVPTFFRKLSRSSSHHGWQTPEEVLRKLYTLVGTFDLDPCSPSARRRDAPVRARVYFTTDDDGLTLPWFGTVFLNPPFGRTLPRWIDKAASEVALGRASTVVALIPARTDTRWWHRSVAGKADVVLLRGRLTFRRSGDSAKWKAPFASAIAVWSRESMLFDAMTSLFEGWVVRKE
jgi:phage N-6-adenine-methyltransferase